MEVRTRRAASARGEPEMNSTQISRRSFLAAGGVLVVGLGLDGLGRATAQTVPGADRFLGKPLAPDVVDSFLAVHADGSVTIFVGKVDIGTGGRIAMRQIVGEELDIPLERIAMIEGDTALTPNQGATAGSYGIARGGTQLRQAAATARQALLAQAVSHQRRSRRGAPASTWEASHLAPDGFLGLDGDVRGAPNTLIVTSDNAPNVEHLRPHDEHLPEKRRAAHVDPRLPWLDDFALDFRFRALTCLHWHTPTASQKNRPQKISARGGRRAWEAPSVINRDKLK